MKLLMQFASGPFTFLILYLIPYEGPSPQGRIALAIFAWMIMWWVTQPVPWAVTSLLPLMLFPAFGLMNIAKTASLYGNTVFFWVMGVMLLGYVIQRHGLAKRFGLWFLSRRMLSGNTYRLVFGFMLATAIISTFISDAATVGMMIPVGMSLVYYIKTIAGIPPLQKTKLGAFVALACLYGSLAGGTATIMGVPYNALSVDMLRTLTGRSLGFFNWMMAGVPIFLVTLVAFYLVLCLFLRPEVLHVPGGREFVQGERAKLGPLTTGERATLFVFMAMVFLFTLPTLIHLTLGAEHPLAKWSQTGLALNVVPPTVVLLLFCTPVNWRKAEFLLTWREATEHIPWDILLLCSGALVATAALVEFGFVKFGEGLVAGMHLGGSALPFVSALIVGLGTQFMTGSASTALFGTILIPAAQQIGFNPASMAMLIAQMATAMILPWGGVTLATTFASGEVELKDMIRIGVVATLVFAFLVAGIHTLLAPIL